MPQRRETIGELACYTVDWLPAGQTPESIVIFCHGYGAPGSDLVPLAAELVRLNPQLAQSVRFVFPQAPLTLDEVGIYGGRAWWPIDVNRLISAVEQRRFREIRTEHPEGLAHARELLAGAIERLQTETGLPLSKFVLGGFSQGAMLTTDIALRLPQPPGALCVFSGILLAEEHWRELARKRGTLPVLQSHGTQDQILPFEGGEWLRDLLIEAGLEVEFVSFDGVHTIPFEALQRCAALIGRIAAAPS